MNVNDPTVVAAFKAALLHQGLIALLIFAVLGLAWVSIRAWQPFARKGVARPPKTPGDVPAEPAGRRVLRVGFGLLWVFDGILQAQPKMALGLPSQVIEPTAASSPRWVQHLVSWAAASWSYHPIQAGASAVWIQVGIGLWLLVAARGGWSRLAGLVSVGWGLVVWVFGESFGGIFAPGLTWLSGAPGAVLLYCVGGALIALPERAWRTPRLGRLSLAGLGLFLIGMAVLQAWPGRGFWQGRLHGQPGTLTGIVQTMAGTPEPRLLSSWVSAFATFTAGHGLAVNLVAVAALAMAGAAFLTGKPQLIRPALALFTVLCLADWVLIEDFGFFGGLGTDPNSMIPFVLLAAAGYLAVAQVPVPQAAPTTPQAASAGPHAPVAWRDRARPAALRQWVMTASFPTVASAGAIALIILGAAPMAAAQANPVADPILAEAINGSSAPLNYPAPAFHLTDQHGRTVTLASLRGKVALLTFLDDTCTADCPMIAQEFRAVGQLLGGTRRVELAAINDNPRSAQVSYIQAFNRQEGLAQVPNWLFLTGARVQLERVWRRYATAPAKFLPAGSMTGHRDYAFIIDQAGHVRWELAFDTGPGSQAARSSLAAELAGDVRPLLGHP